MTTYPEKHGTTARERIFGGVISVLAAQGMGQLTHRRVARAASVSLAATTYHYRSKADMVADVSQQFLDDYIDRFEKLAARSGLAGQPHLDREALIARLIRNTASGQRERSLAWCEIIIDAARSEDGQQRARQWFTALSSCWRRLLEGKETDESAILAGIDIVVGMTFIIHALGLTADALAELWDGTGELETQLSLRHAIPPEETEAAATPKARRTRAQIVEAAIDLLMREGSGGVTYRAIAEMTGLTQSTPAYYFDSIVHLLKEAEIELFRRSKGRYRALSATQNERAPSLAHVVDLTMAIFTREATEYALASIAHYSIWIEAARRTELREEVTEAIVDQARSWKRRLEQLAPCSTSCGLRLQALFIGGLIRTVACGSDITEISQKRQGFLNEISRNQA